MFATIIISLIAILFAFLARYKNFSYGLEASFILLTIFMSIRYNFGNDYGAYLNLFIRIGSEVKFYHIYEGTEVGWNFLCWIFQPIGFFGMIIVLTVFEYTIIYRLIKKYVPKGWYWFSVFIFTFNVYFMLVGASMMRQFLAMCIFILALNFIVEKRLLISILLILLASLFHTSALLILPFCFFCYLNITLTKLKIIILFVIYLLLYFLNTALLSNLFSFVIASNQFERYELYMMSSGDKGVSLGFVFIFNIIIYFILLLHHKYQAKNSKIIFLLSASNLIFYLFVELGPLLTRVTFYLSILTIVSFPLLFNSIKDKLLKTSIFVGYLFITIFIFIQFFEVNGTWHDSFYTYQTIFSAPSWM